MRRLTHRRRLILLPLMLIVVALLAAACSDDDFDDAPQDRGAVAAVAAGAVEPEPEAAPAPKPEPAPTQQVAGDAVRGEDLFFANGCNVCHGDTGGGGIGPAIAKTQLSLSAVIEQYRSPRELMPPFPAGRVSDEDVADIFAFLQSLE